jgi:hypothetical protein
MKMSVNDLRAAFIERSAALAPAPLACSRN